MNANKSNTNSKGLRLRSMFRLDFYRLLHTPALYIMLAISAMIPAMILTTSGEESGIVYNNAWQLVESLGGSAAGANPMDFSGYANINMVFIFAGLLMSIFIAHDYSSGFVKNIFTVHAQKFDYAISKLVMGIFGGVGMLVTYVFGTAISGIIMGISFEVNVMSLLACLLSKAILMSVFCALFLCVSVFFKSKLWLTIVFTFLLGMMFYPAASIATLNAALSTVVISLIAGIVGTTILCSIATMFLKKRDLV